MPRPDSSHLPTLPFGGGSLLFRSKPAGTAGQKDGHQRQPLGGASTHLVSWVRIGGGTSQPGHLGPLRSEAETPGLCHALPPAPAQFMNTPHRAGQLLRSLEPTTFSLKSRGLSKILVGSVSLGIEPGDSLLLGGAACAQDYVFDRRELRLCWPGAKLTLICPGAQN